MDQKIVWVMKELLLIGAGVLISWAVNAQSFGDWFNQNGTQLAYMQAQIEALQVYAQTLQSGYHIVSNGLDTIDRIKNADYMLHAGYYSSLDEVSPAVSSDAQVADIRLYNDRLIPVANAIAQEGQRQPAWGALTAGIAANIGAAGNLDDRMLDYLLTDGGWQMEDAERLEWIKDLYLKAKTRYGFALDVLEKLSKR
jgi:hypothetical protein